MEYLSRMCEKAEVIVLSLEWNWQSFKYFYFLIAPGISLTW